MHHACPNKPDVDIGAFKGELNEDNGQLHPTNNLNLNESLEKRRKRKAKDPKKLFFAEKSEDEGEEGLERNYQTEPEDLSHNKKLHLLQQDSKLLCKKDS